jgi:hypothetical protein
MNYTLGKVPGEQGLTSEIKSTSLYVTGHGSDSSKVLSHIIAKSDYAFGKTSRLI